MRLCLLRKSEYKLTIYSFIQSYASVNAAGFFSFINLFLQRA